MKRILLVLVMVATHCGGGDGPIGGGIPDAEAPQDGAIRTDAATTIDADGSVAPDGHTTLPEGGPSLGHLKTIFLIVMENHNWSDIKGSASAPYINSLLPQASSCSHYFDNPKGVHPSEPNYIWLEAGDDLQVSFQSDGDPSVSNSTATTSHLVTQLTAAGRPWKAYMEGLPAGSCGIHSAGRYAAKHNPFVFFQDITGNPPGNSATCLQHVRPFMDLAIDLAAHTVGAYNFIAPDLCNDMHDDCTGDAIKQGDDWLATVVPKIMASSAYLDNGAIFLTWDESEGGEAPIGMIVLSPLAKGKGYVSAGSYFHSSMLRTVEEAFGLPALRDAANQKSLSDLFIAFP